MHVRSFTPKYRSWNSYFGHGTHALFMVAGEWGARLVKNKTPVILSPVCNKILNRGSIKPENKKFWFSIAQSCLHLHLLPTQAIGAQAVDNSPWIASCTHFVTDFTSVY